MKAHSPTLATLSSVLLSVCVACGADSQSNDAAATACSNEPTAEMYTANMTKTGAMADFKFILVSSMPGPPAKGDNNWSLLLTDMNDAPVDAATISVTPFMPEHGHGPGLPDVVTPGPGPGEYTSSPVNLWMPGLWEVTINASAAGLDDSVVFRFCIQG